jgi:hypothetical protein
MRQHLVALVFAAPLVSTGSACSNQSDKPAEAPPGQSPAEIHRPGGTTESSNPAGPQPAPVEASIKKRAVVYRGPATCDAEGEGCAPAWAAMFKVCQPTFEVAFVGPEEAEDVTAAALASAGVFIYPGGNDSLAADWPFVSKYKPVLQQFVRDGGRYLGSCTGGYLAGMNPWAGRDIGFGLLPGNAGEFIASRGADISTTEDTLVDVIWSGVWGPAPHPIYLQDGSYFERANAAAPGVQVLATYASNGEIAALVAPFGKGKVGVEGPHAEAPADWYSASGLEGAPDFAPGCDLIAKTLAP